MKVIIEEWADGEFTIHEESGQCLENEFRSYEEAEEYANGMGWEVVTSFYL